MTSWNEATALAIRCDEARRLMHAEVAMLEDMVKATGLEPRVVEGLMMASLGFKPPLFLSAPPRSHDVQGYGRAGAVQEGGELPHDGLLKEVSNG